MKGPPLPPPPFATINQILAAAIEHPSGLTFVDLHEREHTFSWAEIAAHSKRVAAGLSHLGVQPGDRVALIFPTSIEFIFAFFGALLTGAVPVPLYPPARLGRLNEYSIAAARMLTAVDAAIVLTDARVKSVLGETIDRARPRLGCRTVDSVSRDANEAPKHTVKPEDLGLIQFSSGATVEPKPVALTHQALVNQCAMIAAMLPAQGRLPLCGVSWLPLYHDMGLIAGPLLALYLQRPLVLIPPENFLLRPALWLRAISRHRATLTPAPPFAFGFCTRRIKDSELLGIDLSSLQLVTCGAEPISLDVLNRFSERFSDYGFDNSVLCPVYGLSEAALAVSFCPIGRPIKAIHIDADHLASSGEVIEGERALVSVGLAIPGVEIEVRDQQGCVVSEHREGQVWIKSASLMSGYFHHPEATAKVLVDGWLDTGDLGFISDGELVICGRAKDIVIIRGANHAPLEFEECLRDTPGVRPGCAVAVGFSPPDHDGEALLILAERDPLCPPVADEVVIRDIHATILSKTGIAPHTIALLASGSLPRTSSGKLRRQAALRLYLAGELSSPQEPNMVQLAGVLTRSARGFLRARVNSRRQRS